LREGVTRKKKKVEATTLLGRNLGLSDDLLFLLRIEGVRRDWGMKGG